jgi:hypothetical protein
MQKIGLSNLRIIDDAGKIEYVLEESDQGVESLLSQIHIQK